MTKYVVLVTFKTQLITTKKLLHNNYKLKFTIIDLKLTYLI